MSARSRWSTARRAFPPTRLAAANLRCGCCHSSLLMYPLLGAAAGPSEVPVVLGRYSAFLAVMLAACAAIVILGVYALRRGWFRIEQVAVIALALISYFLPGSNQVQALWGLGFVLPSYYGVRRPSRCARLRCAMRVPATARLARVLERGRLARRPRSRRRGVRDRRPLAADVFCAGQ